MFFLFKYNIDWEEKFTGFIFSAAWSASRRIGSEAINRGSNKKTISNFWYILVIFIALRSIEFGR